MKFIITASHDWIEYIKNGGEEDEIENCQPHPKAIMEKMPTENNNLKPAWTIELNNWDEFEKFLAELNAKRQTVLIAKDYYKEFTMTIYTEL